MTYPLDPDLSTFATVAQWRAYEAYCEFGTYARAGVALNLSKGTIQQHVKRLCEAALLAGRAPAGYKVKSVGTRTDKHGDIVGVSVKIGEAGALDKIEHIADPKKITKTTTLYNSDGLVERQWVMEKPEEVEREKSWVTFANSLSASILPALQIPRCSGNYNEDLMTVYGVGDHHTGMLAWAEETGGDSYDIKIAERLLSDAITYLVDASPVSKVGVLSIIGDFTHTDGYLPVTPGHGHMLDADGRFPKIADAAARMLDLSVRLLLMKHPEVHVVVTAGNHDPLSAVWLRIALRARYQFNPRVSIDLAPRKFHYFEHGKNLIGFTHGDRMKLEALPAIMAVDRPEAWGRTANRFWFTGHIHNDRVKDVTGGKVFSLRVLAPADAYTAGMGYRTPRDMKAFTFHKEWGEHGVHVAPAAMFRGAV